MYAIKLITCLSANTMRSLLIAALLITLASHQSLAETAITSQDKQTSADIKLQLSIDNLTSIQKSIQLKQELLQSLRDKLKKSEDSTDKQELEENIAHVKSDIMNLQTSFEHIALGGINQSILNEQPEQKINWQDEIEQISRPLLSTLKELTARPRLIDSLRRDIAGLETQIKVIDKAIDSLRYLSTQPLPPMAAKPVRQLLLDWEQRKEDAKRKLEISEYKLNSLITETDTWQASAGELVTGFIHGRGQTLFIAIITSLVIWLLSKNLLKLYWRWLYRARDDAGITRAPLLYYSYRLTTMTVIVLAILMVFYIRGDVLLLTLALIAIAGAALTLRQTLPRYAAEIRLLLGIGPVRENERIIVDGVPFKVDSLSIYTILRNPALEGFLRLPLHSMNEHISRPIHKEKWFPCQPGDYVILANGGLARVIQQGIELVEVAVMDTFMQIQTRDFIEQNVRNLTQEGFGIACSFGIDYQHQAICLDTVPEHFKSAITEHFERAGLKQSIKDILVEFSSAGTSSLDYRIYLTLHGEAANAYYRAQRLVQQACVDTCNHEDWVIPFTQITVHSAAGEVDSTGKTIQATLDPAGINQP